MTAPQPTATDESSLGRDLLYAARYYLGNRWLLLALGGVAAAIGLYIGGWGWLVAAGLAPIVLSTLPCLVMCAFGVCAMCRSNRAQTNASGAAADSATSSFALDGAKVEQTAASRSSCCEGADRPKASI